jgi:hypothetical protein
MKKKPLVAKSGAFRIRRPRSKLDRKSGVAASKGFTGFLSLPTRLILVLVLE